MQTQLGPKVIYNAVLNWYKADAAIDFKPVYKIVKDLESAKATVKKLIATSYHCIKDAEIAAEKVRLPKYHKLNITVEEKKYTQKEGQEME